MRSLKQSLSMQPEYDDKIIMGNLGGKLEHPELFPSYYFGPPREGKTWITMPSPAVHLKRTVTERVALALEPILSYNVSEFVLDPRKGTDTTVKDKNFQWELRLFCFVSGLTLDAEYSAKPLANLTSAFVSKCRQ